MLYHPRRKPGPLALRDRPGSAAVERGDPVQLSRARPHQAADLPLPLAARPDPAPDLAPVSHDPCDPLDPEPARLARARHGRRRIRRRAHRPAPRPRPATACEGWPAAGPRRRPGDPEIEWIIGDLRDPAIRRQAVDGSAGRDPRGRLGQPGTRPRGLSRAINVDATRGLLDDAQRAGVERFVLTSTLHTLAAGTSASPADEDSAWNLECVDSPYARSKREAEALVRQASQAGSRRSSSAPAWCSAHATRSRPRPACFMCWLAPAWPSSRGADPDRRRDRRRPGPSAGPDRGSSRRAVCRRRTLPELRRTGQAGG